MKLTFSLSKLISIIILCVFIVTQFIDAPWNREGAVIKSDIKGYYAYLPAIFIHNDINFKNKDVYWENNESKVWFSQTPEGVRYIKYSIGTAVLYAPFFGMAHFYAGITDFPQDGFSKPYLFALSMSSLVFLVLALYFMRKSLLFFFGETAVGLTLAIIFLGTNAWNYYTFDACYSHGYSLAIISAFIYGSIKWLNNPKYKYALWVGLSFGLMVLIRPIDVLYVMLIPLLFVSSISGFKERIRFFVQQKWQVLIIMTTVVLCLTPQFLYFKFISGHWIFYTYSNESFFFSNPRWLESMFSFRNGWLIYSPLMLLSLVGIVVLKRKRKELFLSTLVIFVIYTFVITSWWCWWYVGFGNRAFINLYPLLCFPLAAIITSILEKKWWWKLLFSSVFIMGIGLSVFQTLQYYNGVIHWGYMTKKAYLYTFLKWEASPLFETYLEIPNVKRAIKGENVSLKRIKKNVAIHRINFENELVLDTTYNSFLQSETVFEGKKALILPDWIEFYLNRQIKVKNANRIYISAWVKNPEEFNLCLSSDKFQFNALSGKVVDHKKGWDKIELYKTIPDNLKNQTLDFFVWKLQRNYAYIDNVTIVLIHEKLVE